ncbi:VWA domain-containing protein [Anaerocellum danielii]|uniref:VWA domain-containing protein n=1 Tax=Anaerocellum danielii TaxID=1387557 RepID=A0ABZ0U085_9FIRM|nr:VWA domain-containing protein [Caldicellulosiruptor danielii]WPX08887.1 VWA domain-containing protein [Caldicellulosiruptor danielii]
MRIEFERPFVLLAAAVLFIFIWLVSRKFSKESLGKRFVVWMRIVLITLIILALSMPKLTISSDKVTTIYLVDMSESNRKNTEKMKDFIQKSIKLKKSNELQSVVVFGQDANIEFTPTKYPNFSEFGTAVDSTQTNIENAIKYAVNLFDDDSQKRLVILTDGKETAGEAKNEVELLKNKGIDVKVVLFKSEKEKDVQFSSLKIPQKVFENQAFSIFANINSTFSTKALLKIFRDNDLIFSQQVTLEKGENRFVIKDKLNREGVFRYQGTVEVFDDLEDSNNVSYAICQVRKPQKVLVVYEDVDDVKNVKSLLDSYSADYDAIKSYQANFGLENLLGYSFVILCNVSKEKLDDKFLSAVEKYVKDLGGGLLVIGGSNSYALGNYSNSVLEKMLPVKMEIKNKEKDKNIEVVLVLDHSGSMADTEETGIPKLEIAKSASAKMIEHLESSDKVGVIAFDHNYYWAYKFGRINKKEDVIESISSIEVGGGTAIIPPLNEAVKTLKMSKAKNKLIVLLTDGMGEPSGYEIPANEAKRNNIKITTIGVGKSVNVPILSWIASFTSGRFYLVSDPNELVDVFLKETKIIKGKYIKEKKFVPKVVETNAINSGFSSYPPLYGYIATTKKDLATSLLVSDEDEPILTVWLYGLGKVAAWCSDLSGQWSRDWILWDKFSQFWVRLLKWLEKGADDSSFDFNVKREKDLVVSLAGKFGADTIATLKCIYPNGKEKTIAMRRTAPDRFESKVDFMLGSYVFVVMLSSKDKSKVSTFFYSANYSDEFRLDIDKSRFEQFIYLSGARVIKNPSEVYEGRLKNIESKRDVSSLLIILCIVLFLLEVSIRRFGLYHQVEKYFLTIFLSFKKIAKPYLIKSVWDKVSSYKKKSTHIKESKKAEPASDNTLDIKKLRRF